MRAPQVEPGGRKMINGNNQSLLRYFAVRTAAFVTLTAASTGFMALPYLG